jgi:acyl carrier protein
MSNKMKYDEAFITVLEVDNDSLNDTLIYNSIKTWDSIGHMQLMSALEDAFDIMLDTDDIIDFSSYSKGKELLNKHGIEF